MTTSEPIGVTATQIPLSYASGTSAVPLLGQTIGDAFDQTAARFPDRLAVVSRHQGVRRTWTQLKAEVDRTARALLGAGVGKGDRVALWSPNRLEWAVVQYATAKVGGVLVTVDPALRTHELRYVLEQSGASTLIIHGVHKSSDYARIVAELVPEVRTGQPGQLHSQALPELRRVICLDAAHAMAGMDDFAGLLALADTVGERDLSATQQAQDFDDVACIQYTSGTTGNPKGASLSHHSLLNNGFFVGEGIGLTEQDRIVVPVPLFHTFGMVMSNLAAMTHGAAVVYPSPTFEPTATLEAVAAERATVLHGVPTMFIAELGDRRFSEFDLSSLRTGIMAGSICPIEVMRNVMDRMHMRDVSICYGMTETSPVSLQTHKDAPLDKRVATVGTIHPHLEVKIVDPAGATVPRNGSGELCTRGYSVMLGYWDNPDATAQAIDRARWMHTGDLAVMDDDGYVTIVGRIKDMIIRGGQNIYPREIEDFLYTHPAITEAQVIGVPDERYGEEVMAWVRLADGASLSEEDVKEFCRGSIAHYKVPRYVKFVDSFPTTASGKIRKVAMRAEAIAELGLTGVAP